MGRFSSRAAGAVAGCVVEGVGGGVMAGDWVAARKNKGTRKGGAISWKIV